MSKIRKVYNLRKTANVKTSVAPEESRVSEVREQQQYQVKAVDAIDKNLSIVSLNLRQTNIRNQQEVYQQSQVEGEELVINKLQLNFDVPINDIEKRDVKIKNIGNSAVYVQFQFKNYPKINNSGFKDTKTKFHCHHQNTVIKPGEQITFVFSFLSDFPGNFTEEVKICCQPPLRTPIPNLKLNGRAFILDEWERKRKQFNNSLSQIVLKEEVAQILNDVVSRVKLPPPPRPDVNNIQIAQKEFERQNKHLNLFFNEYLHGWFNELFNQICQKKHIPTQSRYWDQSAQTLLNLIQKSQELDQVDKKCFKDRLQHYCYLSLTPPPNKSQLYQTIFDFFSSTAYNIGGEYVDAARKELDMWEVAFRQPLLTDTPDDLKARKQEVDKIKAEWVKKAKKKKWGEQEQKQMVNQFKKRVQVKANQNLLNKFTNFEESAQFIKTRQFLKKSDFTLSEYKNYLQRIKTVREYALDGKKVLIKWNLKLKDGVEDKLKQLEQYLSKKKEQEKRLQEEKKDGAKKKKAPPKPKKKGQKQEEELKPLHFDFMSILDQENWNGFIETFKVVMEKQPFLVLIGITYGPRSGRHIPQNSVQFLLEHLKTLQTSIEFFPHDQLPSLNQKLQSQTIGQGSILLLQNLNFLPWEVAQQQVVTHTEEGKPPVITKRKLLHPQIREFFDTLGQSIDVLVNQDRFLEQVSGFTAYLNKEVIMGTQWWRYAGLSMRVIDSSIIFSEQFSPQNLLLLNRLILGAKEVHLAGLIGVKFYLVKHNLGHLGHIKISHAQKQEISHFITHLEQTKISHKLKIPADLLLRKGSEVGVQNLNFDGSQTDIEGYDVIDIGSQTVEQINKISQGNLFVLGQTSVKRSNTHPSDSLSKILKSLFKKQEQKRQRHLNQSNSIQGINYNQDIVAYLIGLHQNSVQKIELRDKKVKVSEQQAQEQGQEEEEGENDKKKIELISDFRLSSLSCFYRLWRGKFDMALKDISKYPIIRDD